MKHIAKIIFIILGTGALISLLSYAVYLNVNTYSERYVDSNLVLPEEVDWETTIEILNTGQVTEVEQAHNLEVTLTLEDGSQVKTIEPSIDNIFSEIELCGRVCREIVLITE